MSRKTVLTTLPYANAYRITHKTEEKTCNRTYIGRTPSRIAQIHPTQLVSLSLLPNTSRSVPPARHTIAAGNAEAPRAHRRTLLSGASGTRSLGQCSEALHSVEHSHVCNAMGCTFYIYDKLHTGINTSTSKPTHSCRHNLINPTHSCRHTLINAHPPSPTYIPITHICTKTHIYIHTNPITSITWDLLPSYNRSVSLTLNNPHEHYSQL